MFKSQLEIIAVDARPDYWILGAALIWVDRGNTITVPAGFMTDLASIPRLLRNLPDLDPDGLSRRPAVLHDFLYATQPCDRETADRTLQTALLCEGASRFAAWVYYMGVHLGGADPWRRYTLGLPQS